MTIAPARKSTGSDRPVRFASTGPAGFPIHSYRLPNAELICGEPIGADHVYFARPESKLLAGIWRSEPYTEHYDAYPCDEFMFILEGHVFVETDDFQMRFGENEAFLIPRGFRGRWRQPVSVVKYYVIVGDTVPFDRGPELGEAE